jgi:hypothetical protein
MTIVKAKEKDRFVNLEQVVSLTVDEDKKIIDLYMSDRTIFRVSPISYEVCYNYLKENKIDNN